jgi:protein-tyrosine phosphatase
MISLTDADQAYLNRFGFNAVVDLRSREEAELFPNTWATKSHLNYLRYDYSSSAMMGHLRDDKSPLSSLEQLYRHFPTQLKPQLKIFFEALLAKQTPLVVNCSAGQDRTGITSALLLTALGVPRDVVVEDYLLSTDFRRPDRELGDVNLEEAAKTNNFAKMMLAFNKSGHGGKANPLVTAEGKPFLDFALDEIEKTYGSVANYLDKEIGVSDADLVRLKALYLQ